jgi:chromate reductase
MFHVKPRPQNQRICTLPRPHRPVLAGFLPQACASIAGMSQKPSLLVFAGSTRQLSFNRRLAQATADIARDAGAQVTLLELSDFDIPMYNADLEAQGTPADVLRLKQALTDHPAWIVCSPEYNGSYTALLKNTIDWASSPVQGHAVWHDGGLPFRDKVVGMLSASNGQLGGLRSQSHLAPLLINLECWLAPKAFALGQAASAFDAEGTLASEHHRQRVRAVVDQVLWASARLHNLVDDS